MTTIRAECPTCGDLRLGPADLTVRVCVDDGAAAYRFRCPQCDAVVTRETSARIVALLESAGVAREDWRLPAELRERHHGPPITVDDLLDFHERLAGDAWMADVSALVRRASTG